MWGTKGTDFHWDVLDWIYSCYCSLASNEQAAVPAMGPACLAVNDILVLTGDGCCCAANHLTVLCLGALWWQPWCQACACRWPGHCCCVCAASLGRLELQWELGWKGLWAAEESTMEQRPFSLWSIQCQSRGLPEGGCDPVRSPCWSWFAGRTCDPTGDPHWSTLWTELCAACGRTRVGEVQGLSPVGETPGWKRGGRDCPAAHGEVKAMVN